MRIRTRFIQGEAQLCPRSLTRPSPSRIHLVRIVLVLVLCFAGGIASAEREFDQPREFPNYFLPEAHRNTAPSSIPATVVEKSKMRIEKALQSILRRTTVPIVREGETQAKMVRYFDYLSTELAKIDPGVKLLPSGGVVRSAIGYLYAEIAQGLRKTPPVSAEETLRHIAEDSNDFPGYQMRGIGSDFDVLLAGETNVFEQLQQRSLQITNSAEAHYGFRDVEGGLKRSLFTVGDVKQYDEQIQRSTNQGGATIDFLAFDIQKGRFVEPSTEGEIANDIVRGLYHYVAPTSPDKIEDPAKQTVRGIRPLIELPFLRIANEDRFKSELKELIENLPKLESRAVNKVLDQFNKATRNARFSAAHNRLYRGKIDSLEQEIEKLLKAFESTQRKNSIPEFVDRFPLRTHFGEGLNGLPPELLLQGEAFLERTGNGTLYHGVPDVEKGLAILRGGLFVSKEGGLIEDGYTTAVFGRGAYSSPHKQIAQGYAGTNGVTFELGIKDPARTHFLDWQRAKDHPFIQALVKKAEKQNKDPFEVLAREHGIDLILNEHVLIQNSEAIETPSHFRDLVKSYYSLVENPHRDTDSRVEAYKTYRQLHLYAGAMGESRVPPLLPIADFARSLLKVEQEPFAVLNALFKDAQLSREFQRLMSSDPAIHQEFTLGLRKTLDGGDDAEKTQASRFILTHWDPQLDKALFSAAFKFAQTQHSGTSVETLRSFGAPIHRLDRYNAEGAPTEFKAYYRWVANRLMDPSLSPPVRLDYFKMRNSLAPYAEALVGEHFANAPEGRLVPDFQKLSMNILKQWPSKFEAFDALMRHGDFRDQVMADPVLNKAWKAGLVKALKSAKPSERSAARNTILEYIPQSNAENLGLHRLTIHSAIDDKDFSSYPMQKLLSALRQTDLLDKAFLTGNPQYEKLIPVVMTSLLFPTDAGEDRKLVEYFLEHSDVVFTHHPRLRAKVEKALKRVVVSMKEPFKPEIETVLRARYPSLWRPYLEQQIGTQADTARTWDLSDPLQIEVVRNAFAESSSGRFPEEKSTWQLFNILNENLDLLRTWVSDPKIAQGINVKALLHSGLNSDTLPIFAPIFRSATPQDQLTLMDYCRLLELDLGPELLADPRWREKARSSLLSPQAELSHWKKFPWDSSVPEDEAFLLEFMQRDLSKEKDFLTRASLIPIHKSLVYYGEATELLSTPGIEKWRKERNKRSEEFPEAFIQHGLKGISQDDRRRVESIFEMPLRASQLSPYLNGAHGTSWKTRDEVIGLLADRLAKLRDDDRVLDILSGFNRFSGHTTTLLMESLWSRIQRNPVKRLRFLSKLRQEIKKTHSFDGLSNYPWDLSFPPELALLRELEKYSHPLAVRFDERVSKSTLNFNNDNKDRFRQEEDAMLQRVQKRHQAGRQLFRLLAEKQPSAFAKAFPESARSQVLEALLTEAKQGHPLNSDWQSVREQFIQQGNQRAIAALLQTGEAEHAVRALVKMSDASLHEYLHDRVFDETLLQKFPPLAERLEKLLETPFPQGARTLQHVKWNLESRRTQEHLPLRLAEYFRSREYRSDRRQITDYSGRSDFFDWLHSLESEYPGPFQESIAPLFSKFKIPYAASQMQPYIERSMYLKEGMFDALGELERESLRKKLIDSPFRQTSYFLVQGILNGDPSRRQIPAEWLMDRLRHLTPRDAPVYAHFALRMLERDFPAIYHKGLADGAVKERLRRLARSVNLEGNFPWDFSQKEDRELLKHFLSNLENKSSRRNDAVLTGLAKFATQMPEESTKLLAGIELPFPSLSNRRIHDTFLQDFFTPLMYKDAPETFRSFQKSFANSPEFLLWAIPTEYGDRERATPFLARASDQSLLKMLEMSRERIGPEKAGNLLRFIAWKEHPVFPLLIRALTRAEADPRLLQMLLTDDVRVAVADALFARVPGHYEAYRRLHQITGLKSYSMNDLLVDPRTLPANLRAEYLDAARAALVGNALVEARHKSHCALKVKALTASKRWPPPPL